MFTVKKINMGTASLEDIANEMKKYNEINCVNWDKFPYRPDVRFAIAHNNNRIYIKYKITEKSLRAKYTANNSNVWTDSCCEFFVSPENNDSYYNFEINCIGTMLLGYHEKGKEAEHAGAEIIDGIKRISTLGSDSFEVKAGNFSWEIIIEIPTSAFFKHKIDNLEGKIFSVNFYKCGDELPEPHFLSWAPINTLEPNFHQPQFFKKIVFEEKSLKNKK